MVDDGGRRGLSLTFLPAKGSGSRYRFVELRSLGVGIRGVGALKVGLQREGKRRVDLVVEWLGCGRHCLLDRLVVLLL